MSGTNFIDEWREYIDSVLANTERCFEQPNTVKPSIRDPVQRVTNTHTRFVVPIQTSNKYDMDVLQEKIGKQNTVNLTQWEGQDRKFYRSEQMVYMIQCDTSVYPPIPGESTGICGVSWTVKEKSLIILVILVLFYFVFVSVKQQLKKFYY